MWHNLMLTWNGACAGDDQVADGLIMENLVYIIAFGIPNLLQNDGVVKTEACLPSQ